MVKKLYPVLFLVLIVAVVYTRFQGINWGLPYPFHPDERNMAYAVEQLGCSSGSWRECLNPHFFAYGQLPLYIAFFALKLVHLIQGTLEEPISSAEATLALRFFSAIWSVATFYLSWKIIRGLRLLRGIPTSQMLFVSGLIFVFVPSLIQFAHFGTTEAFLMFSYTSLVYIALRYLDGQWSAKKFAFYSALLAGLAIGTKVSSIVFLAIPIVALLMMQKKKLSSLILFTMRTCQIVFVSFVISLIVSPHSILHLNDFLSSFRYESSVAQGTLNVFYTRQFFYSIPVWFQIVRIFPYALGWPIFILSIVGFVGLKRTVETVFLRVTFLLYFLPAAFLFTKWTRFMSPVFPLMTIVAAATLLIFLRKIETFKDWRRKGFVMFHFVLILFVSVIPGIAYMSVYNNEDVRITASKWLKEHIPPNTPVLSETANVVDLPVGVNPFISFDFYSVDNDPKLQDDLGKYVESSEYITVPSRRLFANHTCLSPSEGFSYDRCLSLEKQFPLLNAYYSSLFSGKLGYRKIAEFSSYPKIELFGKTLVEFKDESAEETWTVFDHPKIRVFKKIN